MDSINKKAIEEFFEYGLEEFERIEKTKKANKTRKMTFECTGRFSETYGSFLRNSNKRVLAKTFKCVKYQCKFWVDASKQQAEELFAMNRLVAQWLSSDTPSERKAEILLELRITSIIDAKVQRDELLLLINKNIAEANKLLQLPATNRFFCDFDPYYRSKHYKMLSDLREREHETSVYMFELEHKCTERLRK